MNRPDPLTLMILDGWGYSADPRNNAIYSANTPNWDRLCAQGVYTLLDTSGEAVGLPAGQMGNSEVGHMNIGAGRVVYQDFTRITRAIETGEFNTNPQLCAAIDAATAARGSVHIMGLLSPGGVHSHEDHLFAAVRLAGQRGAKAVHVHAFLDGRDTPPRSAMASIQRLESVLEETPGAAVATICGRYFAMDRDQRWDRVEKAWAAMVRARAGYQANTAAAGLEAAYARGENDEFVQPTVIANYAGVDDGDAFIFINFRADRAREISQALTAPDFSGFEQADPPKLSAFVGMTEYLDSLPAGVAFPGSDLKNIFAEVLAKHHLRQLRIAETEKYAHVTFFFNGGREQPFPGEERILVPSPRVATYDLQPEMSAPELTRELVKAINSGSYDVIICNVANADMVGHSGIMSAAIAAVEAVDNCLGQTWEALQSRGGELLVTADHGNVEQMQDPTTGQAHTAHTTNPVPFVYAGRAAQISGSGSLQDIAPTLLYLLGLPQPPEMTGVSLLHLETDAAPRRP